MSRFVDLSRRFRDLTQSELDDPEVLALANEYTQHLPSLSWSELLEHPRVLLLAEAGSGKTAEMREQVARLRRDGKKAFFLAIESLDRGQLVDSLNATEERDFSVWKSEGRAEAWFFLDAVDELKLTQGKLERALGRFAKAVDGLLHQLHVLISCRPSDWRPTVDMATLEARVPYVFPQSSPPPEDEVFLAALTEARGTRPKDSKPKSSGFRTVVLLPLSDRQIETFAASRGVNDTAAFINEIRKQDAWTFARRPLDLSELAAGWNSSGKLGTRTEQHEANASFKLKDDPDRPDVGQLSDIRAREGAERLALAMALTRTRTIRLPEQAVDVQRTEGALDPSAVLRDWDDVERRALIRRALFDPATYGRVRFHHRSVQEYLAACRLFHLREKGLSTKALFRFFFAERYGVPVVIPSVRPIAAWLALWDTTVRNELMRREPEALLSAGDPETLTVETRNALVRRFAEAYGTGGWRGLRVPAEELRRLAHPELADTINDVWGDGPSNSDVRELVLNLIWQGGLAGCAGVAERAAMNVAFSPYERVVAVRALLACKRFDKAREIAQSICNEPEKWPDRIVHALVSDLFPAALNVDELLALVRRTREPQNSTSGFNWQMREIARAIDPASPTAVELTNKIAELVWEGRSTEQRFYEIRGRFEYLAAALALLCHRRLSTSRSAGTDVAFVKACAIANRFGQHESGGQEPISQLRADFSENLELRAAAFWTEMEVMDELTSPKTDWDRMYYAEHDGLVSHLTEVDRPWLEAALSDHGKPRGRAVALQALARLWMTRGRNKAEGQELVGGVGDDGALSVEAARLVAPVPENPEYRKLERTEAKHRRARETREEKRLEDWKKWRESLKGNPDTAFSAGKVNVTLSNLYKWLSARPGSHNRYDVWDRNAIAQAFGEDIAQRATAAFRKYWRTVRPTLWTQRAPQERNSTPWVWLYGLCGIAAEASSPNWAEALTPADATAAAAYGTLALNGFPVWLTELARTHPTAVDAVLGTELTAQLAVAHEHQHLPMLQDLTHAEDPLKRLFAARCLAAATNWPSEHENDDSKERSARHLAYVLQILCDACAPVDRPRIAAECATRFTSDRDGPLGLVWLRGLFRFDAVAGAKVLQEGLAALDVSTRATHAVGLLASLFGDREGIPFAIEDNATRATVLGQMLKAAYLYVRPQEDQKHEGVYTPNTRDHAESARSFLLQTLLDTPGPEARQVILELAGNPLFAHFPDRLRFLARERAAKDAEFEPFTLAQIAALEDKLELPAHDRDGLFSVMIDRLEDLAHDVAHHDFTDRRTLRTIKDESEMQVTLARRLNDTAKGAYIVVREDEVADAKKNDIRLAAIAGDHRAAIEVKIADKRWSIADLEQALRNQLVGQYLRHKNCKAGCLLLTFDGTKSYWKHSTTGAQMSFGNVVSYLNSIAQSLESDSKHEYRLVVFALDLTDPVLAPAHRH